MADRSNMRSWRLPVWLSAGLIIGGALITAATWVAFRHGVERGATGLPVMGAVPEFSLLSSSGQSLSQANLSGQIWIADFVFTNCPGICPTLSAQMAKLQSALTRQGLDVQLVSFTVDPVNDTPEVLRAYAERFHADAARWRFVTGERSALHRLIGDGFHLAVAERSPSANTDGEGLITHSDRFVLVDRNLQIRAYYHGTDADVAQQVLRGIAALRDES